MLQDRAPALHHHDGLGGGVGGKARRGGQLPEQPAGGHAEQNKGAVLQGGGGVVWSFSVRIEKGAFFGVLLEVFRVFFSFE